MFQKIKRLILFLLILLVATVVYFNYGSAPTPDKIVWGVGFSENHAERLGLDWKETYLAILNELPFEVVRLNSYWDRIEKQQGDYDFSNLDFMTEEATKRNKKIVLVLGRRQPRWPECHIPGWAMDLPAEEQEAFVLAHTRRVVERYKDVDAIVSWQVENEFFLDIFGDCPMKKEGFLDREIELVRSLDERPITLTDSGELSWWIPTARRADIFGTTMYRSVYNPVLHYVSYPMRPVYYYKRAKIVQALTGFDRMIISELQLEPWSREGLASLDTTEINYKTMTPEDMLKNIQYAERSGVDEIYVWGPEWWYYMKTVRDIPDFWEQGIRIGELD